MSVVLMTSCSEDQVVQLICALDVDKASGPDGVSVCSIAHSLTLFFNISGLFPVSWV